MNRLREIASKACRAASMEGLSQEFGLQAAGHNLSQTEAMHTHARDTHEPSPRRG